MRCRSGTTQRGNPGVFEARGIRVCQTEENVPVDAWSDPVLPLPRLAARNWHNGSHPSLTSYTSRRSGDTVRFT